MKPRNWEEIRAFWSASPPQPSPPFCKWRREGKPGGRTVFARLKSRAIKMLQNNFLEASIRLWRAVLMEETRGLCSRGALAAADGGIPHDTRGRRAPPALDFAGN
jgi:hypothetical protein